MAYQWDSRLETGYEKIDNQNKQLISVLNAIIAAAREGKGSEELFKTLEFLTGYAILHFSDEEKLMVKYNYSDYLVHKRYHNEFKATVGELTQRLIDEGSSEEMVGIVVNVTGDWLMNHIKGDDFRLAAFIKARKSESILAG